MFLLFLAHHEWKGPPPDRLFDSAQNTLEFEAGNCLVVRILSGYDGSPLTVNGRTYNHDSNVSPASILCGVRISRIFNTPKFETLQYYTVWYVVTGFVQSRVATHRNGFSVSGGGHRLRISAGDSSLTPASDHWGGGDAQGQLWHLLSQVNLVRATTLLS